MTTFVGYSQFLTTFSATGSQYAASVGSCHSLQKTVLVATFALGRLKCTFHIRIFLVFIRVFGTYRHSR